ncbi:MAG: hypothetical protein ACJ8D8_14360 [Microvirga sp.]
MTSQLNLLLQSINPGAGTLASVLETSIRSVVQELLDRGVWTLPIDIWTKGKPDSKRSASSLDDVAKDVTRRAKSGAVAGHAERRSAQVEIIQRRSSIAFLCAADLTEDRSRDALGHLAGIGERIWRDCSGAANVGPGFSVRPINFDYEKPQPPRIGHVWVPGDAAYFLDHEFHESSPRGDKANLSLLISSELPDGVVRHEIPGLTIIRCRGPAEDRQAFASQLRALEVWVSSLLKLPIDSDYKENGDQRLKVFGKEIVNPFTFYDSMTNVGYKSMAETEARDISGDDRKEVEDLLKIKTLPNDRRVQRVIIIFPTRAAAVHNRRALVDLGASGAVYIDDEGELWNPAAVGGTP